MTKNDEKIVAITMGDPSGVGSEIILKAFAFSAEHCKGCVVIGVPAVFQKYKDLLGIDIEITEITKPEEYLDNGALQIINPTEFQEDVFPIGETGKNSGLASGDCITYAVEKTLEKQFSAIVTAPIHKVSFQSAGFDFPGHTEYIAKLAGEKRFAMMMSSGNLNVVLATIHEAIENVPSLITQEFILEKLEIIYRSFPERTKVGVCGLNPHAGEEGKFGNQEITSIIPAIRKMQQRGFDVQGPFPGDTIFTSAIMGEFDVVLAMYHDQGLIPVKLLGFDKAINVTIGLPFLRTSVGHGTAFNIAGKGIASHKSLVEAIKYAKVSY
ncbi:MAG: 4-hydroxythreonine-4-phosphate dehydrogenase PdxA [Nitrospinae bacterium]|nr:4-hydroxythreonine-4-phosphate dehydrogenase PdxA [Nitrospinota bacterium]